MDDSEAGMEDPGIRVIEPLFMTTEVFLWEDVGAIRSGSASRNGSLSSEPATSFSFSKSFVTVDEETSIDHTVTGRLHLNGTVEEPELTYDMDALGLPLSFGTSKVSNNIPSRSKRKSTKPKSASYPKDINRPFLEVTLFNEVENAGSSKILHDSPDEENDCKDLDKKKEKEHGILGSYYCSHSTINEDGVESLELNTDSFIDAPDFYENAAINKKRRIRRSQSYKVHGLTQCISNVLVKYWFQRYSLFARFDDGIKMDDESWFSVTPELIAKHHAFRCGGGSIIDCFTGVGGNAIQFAMRNNHVIAIDVDPVKIDFAQHNAVIYGVSERIDFIKGDFFKIASNLKGDVAFLSPPWGGPDYAKAQIYDMGSLKPHDGYHLFKTASMIASKIVMFLPRNVNLDQLTDLSLSTDPPWKLEVEKNYLNGRLKSITAYFDNTSE